MHEPIIAPTAPPVAPAAVDIGTLLRVWARWSWLVVLVGLLGAAYGLSQLQGRPDLFTARMVVQPDSGGSGLSQLGGQLGQLAAAGGLSIGTAGPPPTFNRLRYLIGSYALANRLESKHGFITLLFGPIDPAKAEALQSAEPSLIARLFRLPRWQRPSEITLAETLRGSVVVDKVRDSPLFEIKFAHTNPELALKVLSLTYAEADLLVREQDLIEARERVTYLQEQLAGALTNDARTSLITLLMGEQRRLMLLNSNQPYAAKIVEAPFVSDRPERINRMLVVGVPAIAAGALVLLVLTLVVLFRTPG